MAAHARPLLWDIYEEHLDEAAFLWRSWERSLCAANYNAQEVADGPEERLRAHLDGLVLAGEPVAQRLLLPLLAAADADADADKAFAAAWALLHMEDADHFDRVASALLDAVPELRGAIARAFELCERKEIAVKLLGLWHKADAAARATIFEVVAAFDSRFVQEHLPAAMRGHEPQLLAAALRLLRSSPDASYDARISALYTHADADVRREALATGFVRRQEQLRGACREQAQQAGPTRRLALALLALHDNGDKEPQLVAALSTPVSRRDAVWALGLAGTRDACDQLVAMLDEPELGPLAGESLSAITGVMLSGPWIRASLPIVHMAAPKAEANDVDPPQLRAEDDLPLPNAEALAAWWKKQRAQLLPEHRYVGGQLESALSLRHALAAGSTWRRELLALQLAVLDGTGVSLNVRGWVASRSAR